MEIVVPFARIKALNPNISASTSADFSDEYYKCIIVSLMSFRKFNLNAKLVLATNFAVPSKYSDRLLKLNVETRIIPFTFEPPTEFGDKFRGCFYIFDVIAAANESALYLDPDVICINNLDVMDKELNDKIGVFELNFPRDYNINGLTINEASNLWTDFKAANRKLSLTENHLGGEAIYIPKDCLVQ